MTSNELRELVKAHFNLVEATEEVVDNAVEEVKEEFTEETPAEEVVEETFGELKDINGAFTLKFPGDSLQVGDKVSVVTAEGQEMGAPDGEHELEDGTKIVTKDSVVEEIMSADGEKEMAEEVEEEMEEEEKEEAMEEAPAVEAVVEAIADVVKEEIEAMKAELKDLKEKMEALSAEPATEKSMPSTFSTQSTPNYNNVLDSNRLEKAIARFKARK